MRVLITGGAGFIGTALAKALAADCDVTLLDLSAKFTAEHKAGFRCIAADVREYCQIAAVEDAFDVIYHFAAQTSGAVSQEQPELDVDTNIRGTLNICRFARERKVKKIVYSSSMAVYGDAEGEIHEQYPMAPKSVYGCSKVAAEHFIRCYSQYGFEYTIFRFFNVYGPGQDMHNMRQGMASIFMTQALLGKKISVTGSFDRFRDFVYIDDVVSALKMARCGLSCDVWNVGSGQKTTVRQLIDQIIHSTGNSLADYEIVNVGAHDGDQQGTVADCRKLKSQGWNNTVSLEEGLYHMANYGKVVLL